MENGSGCDHASSQGCDKAIERYQAILDENAERQLLLRHKDRLFGIARLILFLAFVVLMAIASMWDDVPLASWLSWGSLLAFLVVVTVNEPLRDELDQLPKKVSVVRRLLARLTRYS